MASAAGGGGGQDSKPPVLTLISPQPGQQHAQLRLQLTAAAGNAQPPVLRPIQPATLQALQKAVAGKSLAGSMPTLTPAPSVVTAAGAGSSSAPASSQPYITNLVVSPSASAGGGGGGASSGFTPITIQPLVIAPADPSPHKAGVVHGRAAPGGGGGAGSTRLIVNQASPATVSMTSQHRTPPSSGLHLGAASPARIHSINVLPVRGAVVTSQMAAMATAPVKTIQELMQPSCPFTGQRIEKAYKNRHCLHRYDYTGVSNALIRAGGKPVMCPVQGCKNRTKIHIADLMADMNLQKVLDTAARK